MEHFGDVHQLICCVGQLSGFNVMTYLTLNKLITFESGLIFQNNGFINVDNKYLGTF